MPLSHHRTARFSSSTFGLRMQNSTLCLDTFTLEVADDNRNDALPRSSETSLEAGVARCRICHLSGADRETGELLASPCECRGSLGHVHQNCLDIWVRRRGLASCELCNFRFKSQRRLKPVREWRFNDVRQRLTTEEKGILLLGIVNFGLLFVEFPFLYFIAKMNYSYFQSPAESTDPGNVLPFLLLMLLVFVLIFITTSLIFVFCGAKICRKILDLNSEMVLFIPAVLYRDSDREHVV